MVAGAGVNNAGEPPFEIRGFSLGNAVLGGGILITILSFVDYLGNAGNDGLSVSGLGFVYGIPICLAGCALKYAEIEPVPCITSPDAEVRSIYCWLQPNALSSLTVRTQRNATGAGSFRSEGHGDHLQDQAGCDEAQVRRRGPP